MLRRSLKLAAPSLLVVLLVLTPFLNKAFTIDDPLFMGAAEHVLQHPLHPTGLTLTLDNKFHHISWVRYLTTAYLLAPSAALGNAEWAAHAVMILLMLVALVATVSLALRMGLTDEEARVAGLLCATAPATLAMASTVMSDIPSLAFGVLAVERAWAWKSEGRWHQGVAAVLFLALAMLARSHLLLLLPVCVLGFLGTGGGWRRWLPLGAMAALIGLLMLLGRGENLNVGWGVRTASNLFAYGLHWVLCVPLVVGWIVQRPQFLKSGLPAAGIVIALGILLLGRQPVESFWFVPLSGLGFAVLLGALLEGLRGSADTRALAVWLLIPLPLILYDHMPSKYLAPAAPAAAILVARGLPAGWRRGMISWVLPSLAAVLSLLVISTDARFAGVDRATAPTLIHPGTTTWVDGCWGFAYYAERAGARVLSTSPPFPQPGDRIIRTRFSGNLSRRYPHRMIRSVQGAPSKGQVMFGGAGFFSNFFGYWPWVYAPGPIDSFEVLEVTQ